MNKKWIVYCHTSNDGRRYIGITSNNPNRRWDNGRGYKSNSLFYNYIKKYGWNSIKHDILFNDLTEEQAKKIEIDLIKQYNTQDKKYGFNLTAGGDSGFSPNEETRKKMSISRRKRTLTKETRKKLSEALKGKKNGFYGKHHTKEAKEKIALGNRGKVGYYSGKTLTEEHKRKIGLKSLYRNAKRVRCIETSKEYRCVREACEDLGIKRSSAISMCCNGKRKKAYGYSWEYV